MRSKLDKYSINEDNSKEIISRYCRNNIWKYRKMDWDNDIDGEIEIFDKNRETTAKFIKVQLKTVDNPSKFDNEDLFYSFDADIKFLNFCDVCDIPIILIVFDIQNENGYFLFVQKYISEILDIKNKTWRNNKTSIRVKVPLSNSLNHDSSKNKLKEIAFNGTNTIIQLRKIETFKKYYTVLSQNDNSHGTALRTDMKFLIETSFATSKEAMRILIPKIKDHYSKKVYHRNSILSKKYKNKEYDVLYLFFYKNLAQSKHGIPFCRILWVDENLPEIGRPMISSPDEKIEDINIYWYSNEGLQNLIEDNILDKGDYLIIIDEVFDNFKLIYDKILTVVEKYKKGNINSDIKYIKELDKFSKKLDQLHSSTTDIDFPPNECNDFDIKINNLIAYIHNIRIIISDKSRDIKNIISGINMYIELLEKELPQCIYERNKIR